MQQQLLQAAVHGLVPATTLLACTCALHACTLQQVCRCCMLADAAYCQVYKHLLVATRSRRRLTLLGKRQWICMPRHHPPATHLQDGGSCGSPTSTCVTFMQALTNDDISLMFLVTNITLTADDFKDYTSSHYVINRNLTVTSQPGPVWHNLDFSFLPGRVNIGNNVALTFQDILHSNTRCAGRLTMHGKAT